MGKKGFRKIDTALFQAITATDLTAAGFKVLNAVINYTLGFNQRTRARISLNEFENLTKLTRPTVRAALLLLHEKNIVLKTCDATNRDSAEYYLNTDFKTWATGKVNITPREKKELTSKVLITYPQNNKNLPSRGKAATIGNPLNKENIKKTLKEKNNLSSFNDFNNSDDNTPDLQDDGNNGNHSSSSLKEKKQPVKVFGHTSKPIEWPGDKLGSDDKNEVEDGIRDIMYVLDNGKMHGRPADLDGLTAMDIISILEGRVSVESMKKVKQWFDTIQGGNHIQPINTRCEYGSTRRYTPIPGNQPSGAFDDIDT